MGRTPSRSRWCVGESPEVCGKSVLEVSARVLWRRCFLQWLLLASSEVYGKSRFGPNFDPMDSVCLRTASMEWNVPMEVWNAWRALFLPDPRRSRRLRRTVRPPALSILTSAPTFSPLMFSRRVRLSPCT